MDIKLSLLTGDAEFVNGGTPVTQDAGESVSQKLYIMLRTFAGEWFLNVDHGITYFQSILGQKVTTQAVDLIFQQKILAEEGVQELLSFSSTLNTSSRVYSMSFSVRAHDLVIDIQNIEVTI